MSLLLLAACAQPRTFRFVFDRDATGQVLRVVWVSNGEETVWLEEEIDGDEIALTLDPCPDEFQWPGDYEYFFAGTFDPAAGAYTGAAITILLWCEPGGDAGGACAGSAGWVHASERFEEDPVELDREALAINLVLTPHTSATLGGATEATGTNLRTALAPVDTLWTGTWPESVRSDEATGPSWSLTVSGDPPPGEEFVDAWPTDMAWEIPVIYEDADGSGSPGGDEEIVACGASGAGRVAFTYVSPPVTIQEAGRATHDGLGVGWRSVVAYDGLVGWDDEAEEVWDAYAEATPYHSEEHGPVWLGACF